MLKAPCDVPAAARPAQARCQISTTLLNLSLLESLNLIACGDRCCVTLPIFALPLRHVFKCESNNRNSLINARAKPMTVLDVTCSGYQNTDHKRALTAPMRFVNNMNPAIDFHSMKAKYVGAHFVITDFRLYHTQNRHAAMPRPFCRISLSLDFSSISLSLLATSPIAYNVTVLWQHDKYLWSNTPETALR